MGYLNLLVLNMITPKEYKRWVNEGWHGESNSHIDFLSCKYDGLFLSIGLTKEILEEWYCDL